MPEQNASLQQNLASAIGGQPDPFTQARMQHQAMKQQEASMMTGSFSPMQMGNPMESQQQSMQAPTLQQTQQPLQEKSFPELAKQYGVDISDLHPSKELGGLQLMKRMQSSFGNNFSQHEAFQPLMQAWQGHSKEQTSSEGDMNAMNSRAQRTLGALMGVG